MADRKVQTISRQYLVISMSMLCTSFFCLFFAYVCLEQLQSSLNAEEGMGQIGLSIVYVAFAASSFLIGKPVVHKVGPKWSMFIGFLPHVLYISSMFHISWFTLILASVLLGLGAGVVWVAHGTYVTVFAMEYAKINDQNVDLCLNKTNGIFCAIVSLAAMLGNLFSGIILSQQTHTNNNFNNTRRDNVSQLYAHLIFNSTQFDTEQYDDETMSYSSNLTENALLFCGKAYCPFEADHVAALYQPNRSSVVILLSVLLGFATLSAVIIGLAPNLKDPSDNQEEAFCKRFLQNISIMSDPRLLLLVPVMLLSGVCSTEFASGFNQAFVSCTQGVSFVGYIMVCMSGCQMFSSLICSQITGFIPRFVQIFIVMGITIVTTVTWLLWTPTKEVYVLFLWAVAGGSVNGLLYTYLPAILSELFPDKKEAAFSHFNGWKGLANCITFGYGSYLCQNIKIFILMGVSIVATISYVALEILIRTEKIKKQERYDRVTQKEPNESKC